MKLLAICGLFTAIISFPIAATVAFSKPRTTLKVVWLIFCTLISFWGLGIFFGFIVDSHALALFWGRFLNYTAVFFPILFWHSAMLIMDRAASRKREIIIYYVITIIYFTISLIFPKSFIVDVSPIMHYDYYPKAGDGYLFFFLFFAILMTYAFVMLIRHYHSSQGLKRKQLQYFAFGSTIGITAGSLTFFPVFGIPVDPLTVIFTPAWLFFVAYAIIKHKLLDIRLVIKEGLVYSFIISIITAIYFTLIFLSEHYFQNLLGYNSFIVSLTAAIVFAIFFIPIKTFLNRLVDDWFFKSSFEKLSEQNQQLRDELMQTEHFKNSVRLIEHLNDDLQVTLENFEKLCFQNNPELIEQVHQIKQLSEHISHYTKPTSLELREVEINPFIEKTIQDFKETFDRRRIQQFTVINTPKLTLCRIDDNRFKQALHHLFRFLLMTAEPNDQCWIITDIVDKDQITINVKATGKDLDSHQISNLFSPFFQYKQHYIGLRLAMVQDIIVHHQGNITVESRDNAGIEFTITLPRIH